MPMAKMIPLMLNGIKDTLYMTTVSTLFAYLLGLPLAILLVLTRRHQWHVIRETPFAIHKWSIFSGICHYGGNIIHTFATRGLSTAVAYPLGLASALWTQLWGLGYGEFKGAPKSAYVYLFLSFACYVAGACCVAL